MSNSKTRTSFPLAYHITFGTYGTRLHGDERGTIDRGMNRYGDPIIGKDTDWQQMETTLLRFPPRILTLDQRIHIENALPDICTRGKWNLMAKAAAPDHVHTLLSAHVEGKEIRKWLKRWLGESLSAIWPTRPDQSWWAESGSVKWVWTEDYYTNVFNYVDKQRTVK